MAKTPLSKILIDGSGNRRHAERRTGAATGQPEDKQGNSPDESNRRGASLYEDTLSNRSGGRWASVIWGLFGLIVIGGVVAFFLGSSPDERIIERAESKAKAADDSELSRMVAEVRDREESQDEPPTASAEQPGNDLDSAGVAQPASETPPARANREATASAPASPAPATQPPVRTRPQTPEPDEAPLTAETAPAPAPAEPSASPENESTASPAEPGTDTSQEESESAVSAPEDEAPTVDPAEQAAYEALIEGSQVAAKIVVGAFPTLEYQSWRVVQQNEREIWIDLIANWSNGGSEVHFIWSVSRDGKTVRALSEAARNLERGS